MLLPDVSQGISIYDRSVRARRKFRANWLPCDMSVFITDKRTANPEQPKPDATWLVSSGAAGRKKKKRKRARKREKIKKEVESRNRVE